MKLIIAGSRHLRVSYNFLKGICTTYGIPIKKVTEIVCGEAEGIDTCGRRFAEKLGINVKSFPYLSDLGKAGGPIRNKKMAEYGGGLLLIWNSHSKGSANMKFEARQRELPIWEVILCNPATKRDMKKHGWIEEKPTDPKVGSISFLCHDCGNTFKIAGGVDPTSSTGCCKLCG